MVDEKNAEAGAAGSSARDKPRRPRPRLLVIWIWGALFLFYLASPYLSFWRFTKALQANDRSAMEACVDFPSVRESLKQQLRARIPKSEATPERAQPGAVKPDPFAGLIERLAPALIDQLVDAFITPDGLTALIADPEVAKQARARDPNVLTRVTKTAANDVGWTDVRYAFFTGPTNFLVDVNGTKLRYRFSGFRWVLKTLELPLEDLKL